MTTPAPAAGLERPPSLTGLNGRAARRIAILVLATLLMALGCAAPPSDAAVAWIADALDAPVVEIAAAAEAPPAPVGPPRPAAKVETLGRLMPEPWAEGPQANAKAKQPPRISAAAAVVLDEASAQVLYEKDAHELRGPASTTKIVTAILAAEHGDLDAIVVSDVDSRLMRGSTVMGLLPGDEFTLRDLVYGLMLPSGNDAALAIARHIAGNERAFAAQMTALAARLGLSDSNFVNPHGLGNRNHYSSAYDLAILARYMMQIPELRDVAGARSWTANGSRKIEMRTLNALLAQFTGSDGVKTGYTRSSGRTFVASAVRDGHRVYVVLLDAPERELDARRLLEWAFEAHRWTAPSK